ncbi:unnamed protein product [Malus baccata var. baccata]
MNTKPNSKSVFSVILLCAFLESHVSPAADTISENQSFSGDQTIVSAGGMFELGFFKPDGNLVLLNMSQTPVWSTDLNSTTSSGSVQAVLLDSGNLVLRAGSSNNTSEPLWQSLDQPTHTWLPGGRLGFNKITDHAQILTSWKNLEDPAPGLYSLKLSPDESNSYILLWNRSKHYWTSGSWDESSHIFNLVPEVWHRDVLDLKERDNNGGDGGTLYIRAAASDIKKKRVIKSSPLIATVSPITEGIAQGVLYIHKYSRLKIIHRDLKASNIWLDGVLNPKISDFGMAKIFGINQTEANTNRVVGTYSYMSLEYARYGHFSKKLDVFSFGVLLLEFVSGKKNAAFYRFEHSPTLVGWAWELWKEGRGMEVIDESGNESTSLPPSKELAFSTHRNSSHVCSSETPASFSHNAVTMSLPEG